MATSREAKLRQDIQTVIGTILNVSKNITNVSLTSNVVTITAVAHGFKVGHWVTITAVTQVVVNGTYVITEITADTFTYAVTHADIVSIADTGTAVQQNARLGLEDQIAGSDFYNNLPTNGFCIICPARVGKWDSQHRHFPIEIDFKLWFPGASDTSIDFTSYEDVWSPILDALALTTNFSNGHPDEIDFGEAEELLDFKPIVFEYKGMITFMGARGAA